MNRKSPRASLSDKARNHFGVYYSGQPDRSRCHPEQAILEAKMKLYPPVDIDHHEQPPAQPEKLSNVGKTGQRGRSSADRVHRPHVTIMHHL